MALPFLVPLVLPALVAATAMALCGLACRWRHRPGWLCLWLLLSVPAASVAVSALLDVLRRMAWAGSAQSFNFLNVGQPVLVVTFATLLSVVAFAGLLPFLILSWVSPFFRERLKALLNVKPCRSR
jgi:hypothetical protein